MFTTDANLALTALEAALPKLSLKDASFAKSLLGQAMDKGSLSEKQMFWVKKLAAVPAQGPVAPAAVEYFPAIVALFDKVAGKFPAIVYQGEAGPAFRLSRAGAKAKEPGSINVCDTGKSFDTRVWYGRISLDGKFTPSAKVEAGEMAGVVAALKVFEADPAKAAAEYGHKTGNCCFCGLQLDNMASVAVGYGPVCAKKWGLPHSYSGKFVAEAV
jgi:hypothetical protein